MPTLRERIAELERLTPSDDLRGWFMTVLQEIADVLEPLKQDGTVSSGRYGVPVGTKEYWRRYYADPKNKAKRVLRATRFAEKKRKATTEARTTLPIDTYVELADEILLPDRRVGDRDDRDDTDESAAQDENFSDENLRKNLDEDGNEEL